MIEELPPTDLARLVREVANAEAALPRNLSDYWLDIIARDLDTLQDGGKGEGEGAEGPAMSGPLYLIIKILEAKAGGKAFEVSEEQMLNHFLDYQIEVNLEVVSRRTEVKAAPASLETIFTNRDVTVSRDPTSFG